MTEATIVYDGGSGQVSDFHFIETVNVYNSDTEAVRVWYSDPEKDDSDYEDYPLGRVIEVTP